MTLNWCETLGNWNPQLARELRGRLTLRNLIAILAIAIVCQIGVVFLWNPSLRPTNSIFSSYCQRTIAQEQQVAAYADRETQLHNLQYQLSQPQSAALSAETFARLSEQLRQTQAKLEKSNLSHDTPCPPGALNRSQWWREQAPNLFRFVSLACFCVLLVGGTHLLIDDLGREEKRGTLSFIRLSPRSGTSVLLGKLLGVPCLLYLGVALVLPWQFWIGQQASLSIPLLATLDTLALIVCLGCHSGALLFGLASFELGGLQAWLGSGLVAAAFFLPFSYYDSVLFGSLPLFHLLHPLVWGQQLIEVGRFGWEALQPIQPANFWSDYSYIPAGSPLLGARWYELPLDRDPASLVLCVLSVTGLATLFCWQGLLRRFDRSQAPLWTRRQSYRAAVVLQLLALGFSHPNADDDFYPPEARLWMRGLLSVAFLFSLSLALSPTRATLIDWARYRHQQSDRPSLWADLLRGEGSPTLLVMGLHAAIACGFSIPALALAWDAFEPREFAAGVALFVGIALLMLSALQLASLATYRRLLVAAAALLPLAGLWGFANYALYVPHELTGWWQSPWLWWSLGLAIAAMNAGFVLWLRHLGAAATRSHLTSRSPRLQPVRQPDRR